MHELVLNMGPFTAGPLIGSGLGSSVALLLFRQETVMRGIIVVLALSLAGCLAARRIPEELPMPREAPRCGEQPACLCDEEDCPCLLGRCTPACCCDGR